MMREFDVIAHYFSRPTRHTALGVGDDAAIFALAPGMQLAVSADMLVTGTHFFHDADPEQLGWKSLAVNVSDMAAMGALPKWATLAIALPQVDEAWLAKFSEGFFDCADQFGIDLIGGDTTRGQLTISVQMMGEIPAGQAITRYGAKVGDDIWVSGCLGHAALGLAHLQNKISLDQELLQVCFKALHTPQPRVALGLALRGIAHSAIDVSDGLLADLGHIAKASHVGAELQLQHMPCNVFLQGMLDDPLIQQCILSGGDDYEICFTAPQTARETIARISETLQLPLTRIGNICVDTGVRVDDANCKRLNFERTGYDHFA